jgi:hypothetical protein
MCECVAYLQSPAVRGRGVRDGGGPYMPPWRFYWSMVELPYVGLSSYAGIPAALIFLFFTGISLIGCAHVRRALPRFCQIRPT